MRPGQRGRFCAALPRRYSATVVKATRGTVDPSAALHLLRDALVRVRFPLQTTGAEAAEDVRDAMVDQLDDCVLPRLAHLDAPLLAVIGGSTGAGKSTLVNALVGSPVSSAGLLRPTTRLPVLVHHPADGSWFASDQLLPTVCASVSPTEMTATWPSSSSRRLRRRRTSVSSTLRPWTRWQQRSVNWHDSFSLLQTSGCSWCQPRVTPLQPPEQVVRSGP